MATKSKSSQHKKSSHKPNPSNQKSKSPAQNRSKTGKPIRKERGFWLTFALVIMILFGIAAAIFYISAKAGVKGTYPGVITIADPQTTHTIALTLMIVHNLANIVAAAGIWFWKKWALYVLAVSAILALVAGLITVGAWSVFYMVLPVVIVGWLLRTKWNFFE
jgi:hypothetical protein